MDLTDLINRLVYRHFLTPVFGDLVTEVFKPTKGVSVTDSPACGIESQERGNSTLESMTTIMYVMRYVRSREL